MNKPNRWNNVKQILTDVVYEWQQNIISFALHSFITCHVMMPVNPCRYRFLFPIAEDTDLGKDNGIGSEMYVSYIAQ